MRLRAKQWGWLSAIAAVPVLIAVVALFLPAAPQDSATAQKGFARLQVGMTAEEVEVILGGPPGDYNRVPFWPARRCCTCGNTDNPEERKQREAWRRVHVFQWWTFDDGLVVV